MDQRNIGCFNIADEETRQHHVIESDATAHRIAFNRLAFRGQPVVQVPNPRGLLREHWNRRADTPPAPPWMQATQPLPVVPRVPNPPSDSWLRLPPGPEAEEYRAIGKEMEAATVEDEACAPVAPKKRQDVDAVTVIIGLLVLFILVLSAAIIILLFQKG